MRDRALVEPVDLELEPVEAEPLEEVPDEQQRRLVRETAPAVVGVDGEPAEVRDPAAPVRAVEAHRPRPQSVDLDHEAAARVRVGLALTDLCEELLGRAGADDREEGRDLLVRDERHEELDVVLAGPPDRDGHGGDGASAGVRPRSRRAPEAKPTPARMSARPPIAAAVTGSSSSTAP